MKNNLKKKALAWVLTAEILVAALPASVFGEDPNHDYEDVIITETEISSPVLESPAAETTKSVEAATEYLTEKPSLFVSL